MTGSRVSCLVLDIFSMEDLFPEVAQDQWKRDHSKVARPKRQREESNTHQPSSASCPQFPTGQRASKNTYHTMTASSTTTTASTIGSMDDWNVDVVLQVLPYLTFLDVNRFQLTSRRYWYLVQEYRRLWHIPNMVTMTREDVRSTAYSRNIQGMMQYAVHHKLQTSPNFLFASFEPQSALSRDLPG